MSLEFSADAQKKIQALCERYQVSGSKQPVVMAALHLAQKDHGHLSDDALRLVARTLDLPYAHVYGVATFYTMYRREPSGTSCIRMCTNISCMLRGGYDVLAAFEQKLGVKAGATNAAKTITLIEEECIAACANAPCAVVGTKYYLDIQPGDVAKIVAEVEATPRPESEVV
ncbi:MAG TPA: NAD(P)H-dependent oxidoreductase subunit E [Kofleriaceae bacterium]|jgi:NADH-quinone oxidoreductase E subunit|nr:NAD(P)H-dependent oxidoreductase subunit E [Kofleriaceae bacterium]